MSETEVDRQAQELIDRAPGATLSAAYREVAIDWLRRYQQLLKAYTVLTEGKK